MSPAKLQVAVLDDYQGFSEPVFQALDRSSYEIRVFKDTILPYGHPGTPDSVRDALVERLRRFDIICTMRERTPFPSGLISRLPNLKLLLTTGLRNAALDLAAFRERGIPVAGSVDKGDGKSVGTSSTTQHCVALILALARHVAMDDLAVKSGAWQTGFATGLSGKVLGQVGLGRLGTSVARIMHDAFGMRVVAWSANLTQEAADVKARASGLPVESPDGEKTFKVVSREELFEVSDVLSVHLVLSDRSRGLIGEDDFGRMKKSAFFINTSRGPLVKEGALLKTLEEGKIRGAALDVFDLEPLPVDSPWRTTRWGVDGRSEVLLTPHMGYVEEETVTSWYEQQVENIKRWKAGEVLVNAMA